MSKRPRRSPPPARPVFRPARRRWPRRLAAAIVLLAVLAAAAWWLLRGPASSSDGPIILISIDTLRADHLPVYGYRGVATPAIDAFAADGVVFDRAYAHSPQTFPSHASILSGRLPFETGARDNIGFTLKPDVKLLPQMLAPRGYVSGGVVSAYVLRRELGLARAFDFYDSQMPIGSPELSVGQVQRRGEESAAIAERWVASLSSPRFFLFFHIYEPHKPYEPPARYAQYTPYDGEIAYSDEIVGRFLGWLKDRRLYDRATIVLLSDHGEGLGDHGEQEHGLFLYDETIRVPLVVKLPGGRNGGRRIGIPVQHIDLVPTILDLAGVAAPAGLRGRSLRALLEGRPGGLPEQGFYAESFYARYHFGWSELQALTDARYRFIKAPREELYDLDRDPRERTNVLAERAQTGLAMRGALERLVLGAPLQAPGAVSAEDRQRLAALGYVGTGPTVVPTIPGTQLPDPKDKVPVLEKYRTASELAGERRFVEAIAVYREILATDPEMSDVWLQLAEVYVRADRVADAVDAYKRAIALNPGDGGALLGAAGGLLLLGRLDEAKAHAELAVPMQPAAAHEMLTKIAMKRNDPAAARREAALALQADPTMPMPLFVEGMQFYRAGKYQQALPLFEEALAAMQKRVVQMNELHFYLADTLARLERYPEAEMHFKEEIRLFPHNVQARISLAMLYRAEGRDAEVEAVVDDLLRAVPTPEGFARAARLWTVFGDKARADAVRTAAAQRFGRSPRP